jgi:CRISPR-associated protein Csm4
MELYKIIPRAPFHFGERGIGQEETAEFPHSDTLFAALISAWRLMYGPERFEELVEGATRFAGTPPVRISSAFPYIGDVCFLPRPAIPLEGEDGDRKRGKRVAYVSWRRAEDLAGSEVPPTVQARDTVMSGRLWVHPREKRSILTTLGVDDASEVQAWSQAEAEAMARVTVDRADCSSALYYQGMVHFAEGCGFYLLAEVADQAYRGPLEDGLEFLGEQGLGGRRSVGLGQFELEKGTSEALGVPPGRENYYWLLSLYHPTREEVRDRGVLSGARYLLITRRGWIYSPDDASQRRRAIRMLAEGSLLPKPAMGNVVDVQPAGGFPHAVWRSGLALTVTTRRWRHA